MQSIAHTTFTESLVGKIFDNFEKDSTWKKVGKLAGLALATATGIGVVVAFGAMALDGVQFLGEKISQISKAKTFDEYPLAKEENTMPMDGKNKYDIYIDCENVHTIDLLL